MPAIAIAAGITAAGSLAGAAISSHAASGAAQDTKDYNDKALAAAQEEQQYERQRQATLDAQAVDQRDYQRSQTADYNARLTPYIGAGNAATSAATSLLASSPYAARFAAAPQPTGPVAPPGRTITDQPTVTPPVTSTTMPVPNPMPNASTTAAAMPGPPVLLRAPTGVIKQVPAEQVQHFLSLGATRV